MPRLALAGLLLLAGCANSAPPLQPIPAPAAVIVKVPTLVPLPPDATMPCPEPQRREIRTDVDLLTAADAFRVAMKCNAAKLRAIGAAQP